jgi:tetratricopeptide (TPR) repeat protein
MIIKIIKFLFIIILFYQTPLSSKSNTLEDFSSKDLSKYFSGIVAFENKDNSKALDLFNSSKILINKHDPYFKRYIYSLVLENQVSKAVNLIKQNKNKNNSKFFESYLMLILDSLKKDDFNQAYNYVSKANKVAKEDRFNLAILDILNQYIFVFKENKILKNQKNFGNLSIISETFQRCYLNDPKTDEYFLNLINSNTGDFTRYTYFYLTYLIQNNRVKDAKEITNNIKFINSTLLLSQGKSWIENHNSQRLTEVFSCKNHNDLISEFLFLISNLYSSQDDFKKSNFYLNLSYFLNSKFYFNLSLVAENKFSNNEYEKAKKILKKFKKQDYFYYWYRVKKEAQIIAKLKNENDSLNFIISNFKKLENYNEKILFDIANFYKNAKKYNEAIKYYSKVIEMVDKDLEIKADVIYRRGGSYERLGNYDQSDKDMLQSLEIIPDNAYVLNYLAYSWLERDYKINSAINMLEKAYAIESDDPYIIDSIGWAYYLLADYKKAEKYLRRAVELMPDDSIVNDHYGDSLWRLGQKIQARYFWRSVLKMENTDEELLESLNSKIIKGL